MVSGNRYCDNHVVFEKFTVRARQAVIQVQEAARARQHDFIGTEHLLLGLITNIEDPVVITLHAGVEPTAIRGKIDELRPCGNVPPRGHIPFTPHAKKTLERSVHEAQLRGHERIDAEHVLCALTKEPDAIAANVLTTCGAPCESVRERLELLWRK